MGRIDHTFVGEQTGCDIERIKYIENGNILNSIFVELNPGDTLFFHCNLLHRSAPNKSDQRRFALLAAYNKQTNIIHKKHHHYNTEINIINDDEIKNMGVVPTFDMNVFMDHENDSTINKES